MGGHKQQIYPSGLGADYDPFRDLSPMGGGYAPGPLGLDSDGDAAAPRPIALDDQDKSKPVGDAVLAEAQKQNGKKVGDGECFTLVDRAMKAAGAKSAGDYGSVAPEVDYVWGTETGLGSVKPGDVIQFRNYRYDRTVDSPTAVDSTFGERPHHTAIVVSVGSDGELKVIEQNAPNKGDPTSVQTLYFKDSETESGGTKTTIKVTGSFKIYRPQRK